MMSKKEMGLIALAGVGIVGIGVLGGFGNGGGGVRAGKILGSPGTLPSAGTGSAKQIAAVTGYLAPGAKVGRQVEVTPQVAQLQPKKKMAPSTQMAGYIGGVGPLAYKAPTQFVKPSASTSYEFLASPSTAGRGRLTAKGVAVKQKVEARKKSGFVGYSGGSVTKGTASAQKKAYKTRSG